MSPTNVPPETAMKYVHLLVMKWHWWVPVLALLLGLLILLNIYAGIMWVGGADIEISFVVTDRASGKPIPGSQITVQAEKPGFCHDDGERHFVLTTGADGIAKKSAKDCMCFGEADLFFSTWGTHVPDWQFIAEAAGYNSSERVHLSSVRHLVKRPSGPTNVAHLNVPIVLNAKD
jgi:hypothetical protein